MQTQLPVNRFSVGFWNEADKAWELLPSRVFWDGRYGAIEAETGHASGVYALLWLQRGDALSTSAGDSIRIAVDYELLNANPAPYVKEGRTMVPLRLVAGRLKADLNWTGSEQRIDLVRGLDTVQLWVGKPDVMKNKKPLLVSDQSAIVAPEIVNGTTYVPLRLISEAFGVKVAWDGVTKTVYIQNY
ncbi:copper amine oxidase domain protein, putative [Heliomicrobium modesticaldum Ice1]|uniref:Copper amine oxidase domain protein, putative n=2 Tax=Heliomicrobium modesticaldum TaxID=35701 RepID=B0THK0_HELMI|nr:copper amine oxidase domain protein, putative [Heliomicrobium modesticaldum Ice1]